MTPGHTQNDALLAVAEAAAIVGVSVDTMRRYANEGRLPYLVTPGGHRRFRRGDVEGLLTTPPDSHPEPTEAVG